MVITGDELERLVLSNTAPVKGARSIQTSVYHQFNALAEQVKTRAFTISGLLGGGLSFLISLVAKSLRGIPMVEAVTLPDDFKNIGKPRLILAPQDFFWR